MTPRHFLDIAGLAPEALRTIIDEAHRLKARGRGRTATLAGRTLALLFEKPSTRTRFSFDIAMREMGGDTIVATGSELHLGRGETLGDTAAVLSRYVDGVMVRILDHDKLAEFARHATIPVINGLTRRSHPCQIVADLMTVEERLGPLPERTIAWVGDGNNVASTFVEAAPLAGYAMRIATPAEFALPETRIAAARAAGARIDTTTDPREAVAGADVVVTDAWCSMGDEDEDRRRRVFAPYQVDEALMAAAAPGAIFLHCLPAHRGEEVTDAVMDGPQSAVFDEAENRLHAQKAILAFVFRVV